MNDKGLFEKNEIIKASILFAIEFGILLILSALVRYVPNFFLRNIRLIIIIVAIALILFSFMYARKQGSRIIVYFSRVADVIVIAVVIYLFVSTPWCRVDRVKWRVFTQDTGERQDVNQELENDNLFSINVDPNQSLSIFAVPSFETENSDAWSCRWDSSGDGSLRDKNSLDCNIIYKVGSDREVDTVTTRMFVTSCQSASWSALLINNK